MSKKKSLICFRQAQEGGAAIEFALVGGVFLWLLLGIMELGAMLIMSNALDDAVAEAARMVRTGQVARNGITQEQMKQLICGNLPFGGKCNDKLLLDVRRYSDFASMTPPPLPALGNGGSIEFAENYQTGNPKDVVLFRAFYTWKFATPFMSSFMGNLGDDYMLGSAATFRNEPYEQH